MKLARREALLGLATLLFACRRDRADPPDRGQIVTDLTNHVILPTYSDAVTDAAALATAMTTLRDAPTAESLAAARDAWRQARSTWKLSDAFLFGPADDLGVTAGAIDTKADAARIEAFVARDAPIDAAAVGKLGANEKGFGGLEVLLFGPVRHGTFGALLAMELVDRITAVRDAWTSSYARELTTGRGSIDIVVNALVSAAEIIVTLRLAQPLGLDKGGRARPEAVESPLADASLEDLQAELSGIEAIYLGTRNGVSGLSLADAVADRSPSVDAELKATLSKAKAAVQAIPGPLRTAVVNWRDAVQTAHQACRDLKRLLATDVTSALGTSLGFTITDGD
jgi:predicted lipoprotein